MMRSNRSVNQLIREDLLSGMFEAWCICEEGFFAGWKLGNTPNEKPRNPAFGGVFFYLIFFSTPRRRPPCTSADKWCLSTGHSSSNSEFRFSEVESPQLPFGDCEKAPIYLFLVPVSITVVPMWLICFNGSSFLLTRFTQWVTLLGGLQQSGCDAFYWYHRTYLLSIRSLHDKAIYFLLLV